MAKIIFFWFQNNLIIVMHFSIGNYYIEWNDKFHSHELLNHVYYKSIHRQFYKTCMYWIFTFGISGELFYTFSIDLSFAYDINLMNKRSSSLSLRADKKQHLQSFLMVRIGIRSLDINDNKVWNLWNARKLNVKI